MRLTPTEIEGVTVVDLDLLSDERGFFARVFDGAEFAAAGLTSQVAQASMSFNRHAGTVRGLHRLAPPYAEGKLVRCVVGAIADVAVDVRPGSPTFGRHVMVELSASNRRALFVPPHVAHGYQALTDDVEMLYLCSVPYAPDGEDGYRHDDPAFGIPWPLPVRLVSAKDAAWPLLADRERTAT